MIPATQNAYSTLQKHYGCLPQPTTPPWTMPPRPRGALPILLLRAKIRDLAQNTVFVDRGRGRVGGEGVVGRG